jgi:hypothetical protein
MAGEAEPAQAAALAPPSDEAVEQEPRLKYARFERDVPGILGRQAATRLCVSDKLLALGTRSGAVHVLDYGGNEVRPTHALRGRAASLLRASRAVCQRAGRSPPPPPRPAPAFDTDQVLPRPRGTRHRPQLRRPRRKPGQLLQRRQPCSELCATAAAANGGGHTLLRCAARPRRPLCVVPSRCCRCMGCTPRRCSGSSTAPP